MVRCTLLKIPEPEREPIRLIPPASTTRFPEDIAIYNPQTGELRKVCREIADCYCRSFGWKRSRHNPDIIEGMIDGN